VKSTRITKRTEVALLLALLFHLQWMFGNIYEEILIPNSVVASTEALNNYNKFFSLTEPYYYYVPLTQIGTLIVCYAAIMIPMPQAIKRLMRRAALASGLATALTIFIVTQYNLKMFFGDVSHFGDTINRLYLEWAVLNAFRILLVGTAVYFIFKGYQQIVQSNGANHSAEAYQHG
jgi:hypothetical protein